MFPKKGYLPVHNWRKKTKVTKVTKGGVSYSKMIGGDG
jgi:hypothetical protein